MNKYLLSLMGAYGNKINKIKHFIRTAWKWLTSKQDKSDTLEVVQKLNSSTDTSRKVAIKKHTIKRFPLCPVTQKISREEKQAKLKAKASKGIHLRAYKCEFCPYWHLTHKKDKKKFH